MVGKADTIAESAVTKQFLCPFPHFSGSNRHSLQEQEL